jgi:hypothetical protein
MVVKTRNPVERKILQQGVVVSTANGLPVDSTVTIEGTNRLLVGDDLVTYNGTDTVTVDPKYNLELVKTSPPRYTGQLVFIDGANNIYYVDRQSINSINNTFKIYTDQNKVDSPSSIDLQAGWILAEAKLVNRLATTSVAHIDEVVFNGFDVNMNLDGSDKIQVTGTNGNTLEPNPDGSINANVTVTADDGDNIAISRHENPFRGTAEATFTDTQLSTSAFTQIFSYTSTLNYLRIQQVKVDPATYGTFKVKVNGVLIDQVRNSPTQRTAIIRFPQDEDLNNGAILTVEFKPDRIRIPSFGFFLRLDGYIQP